ncbi:MAG: uracil-DNA glycosylase [Chloroflexota bacterium]|jgi:DNA polymerase|nr:uracil-DNA glycosylase [Chloroflexota bacterium]
MALPKLPDDWRRDFGDPADREEALDAVREAARECRACPLFEIGWQTVFGAGPADARLMLIGEAPGEHEDAQGIPFVGPAGRLLDEALTRAGIDRGDVYITNVVKHRPWIPVGKRKKNRPPKQSEINACRPWLDEELEIVEPALIGCLGAPAAKQILGKDFKLMQQRGQWFTADAAPHVLATIHPAFVLIQPEESFDRWREVLFADFRIIAERLRSLLEHSD